VGVLLQGLFFGPGRMAGVPSPPDGDPAMPWWWDHLVFQPFAYLPRKKARRGSFSSGYDL
jgi:hypothetical protein